MLVLPVAYIILIPSLQLCQLVSEVCNLSAPMICQFGHFVEATLYNMVLSDSPLPLLLQRVHAHLVISNKLIFQHIYFVFFSQVQVRPIKL